MTLSSKKHRAADTSRKWVHFQFTDLHARSVCIAGTFNDWDPRRTVMANVGDGRWIRDLFLPAGGYEYCLVVDSKWIPDPRVAETTANPFGGVNSVLEVD